MARSNASVLKIMMRMLHMRNALAEVSESDKLKRLV